MNSDVFPFFYAYLNITFHICPLDLNLMTEHHLRQLIYNLEMSGLARLEEQTKLLFVILFVCLFLKKVIKTILILLTLSKQHFGTDHSTGRIRENVNALQEPTLVFK